MLVVCLAVAPEHAVADAQGSQALGRRDDADGGHTHHVHWFVGELSSGVKCVGDELDDRSGKYLV